MQNIPCSLSMLISTQVLCTQNMYRDRDLIGLRTRDKSNPGLIQEKRLLATIAKEKTYLSRNKEQGTLLEKSGEKLRASSY